MLFRSRDLIVGKICSDDYRMNATDLADYEVSPGVYTVEWDGEGLSFTVDITAL